MRDARKNAAGAIMMPDRVRAFVALTIAPEVEQAVADFIESMRTARDSRSGSISWIGRNKLHLTLRFLGDGVAASTLERLDGALAEIATATACFSIGIRGIGAFPRQQAVLDGLHGVQRS